MVSTLLGRGLERRLIIAPQVASMCCEIESLMWSIDVVSMTMCGEADQPVDTR
jgi:hypothetical protein